MKYLINVTDLGKLFSNCRCHKSSKVKDTHSAQYTPTTLTTNLFNLCSAKFPSNGDVVDIVFVAEVAQDWRRSINVVQQHALEVVPPGIAIRAEGRAVGK